MTNLLRKYQTLVLFVVVVAVLYGGYQFFFAPSNEPALSVSAEAGVDAPDQELIALLLQLKSIHLDDSLFNDNLFKSLIDFGKDLVSEPVGRTNPFAPFSGGEPAKDTSVKPH